MKLITKLRIVGILVWGCSGAPAPSEDFGPRQLPYVPAPTDGAVPQDGPPLPPPEGTRLSSEGAWAVRAGADERLIAWADYNTTVVPGPPPATVPASRVRLLELDAVSAPVTVGTVDAESLFAVTGTVVTVVEAFNQINGTANLVVAAKGSAPGTVAIHRLAERGRPFVRIYERPGAEPWVAWLSLPSAGATSSDLVWARAPALPTRTWARNLGSSCFVDGVWLPAASVGGAPRFLWQACDPSARTVSKLWLASADESAPQVIVDNTVAFAPSLDVAGRLDGAAIAFVTSAGRLGVTRGAGAPIFVDENVRVDGSFGSPLLFFPQSSIGLFRTTVDGFELTYLKGEQIVRLVLDTAFAERAREIVVSTSAKGWAYPSYSRYPVALDGRRMLYFSKQNVSSFYGVIRLAQRGTGAGWSTVELSADERAYAGDDAFAGSASLFFDRAVSGTLGVGRLSSHHDAATATLDDRAWLVRLLPQGRALVLGRVERRTDGVGTHEGDLLLVDVMTGQATTLVRAVTFFDLLGESANKVVYSRRDGVYRLDLP